MMSEEILLQTYRKRVEELEIQLKYLNEIFFVCVKTNKKLIEQLEAYENAYKKLRSGLLVELKHEKEKQDC